jgi:homoserine kinase type II
VDRAVFLLARITELYPVALREIDRLARGMGTENWRVETVDGKRLFLKVYAARWDRAEERQALVLAMRARMAAIRTPMIIPDRDGDLLRDDGEWAYALFDYVSGASPASPLSTAQMVEAGVELAKIHRSFRDIETSLPSQTPSWLQFSLEAKQSEIETYQSLIAARTALDAFDTATLSVLPRRKSLLAQVPRLLAELANAESQVLHGDYSVENVLFHDGGGAVGGSLAAVVDFRPPKPFLLAYEIGRIAFPPEHFAQDDWLDRGVALLTAYRDENPRAAGQIGLAPIAWLVQLLRSTYGLKQHYETQVERQMELDRFWLERARGAEILFDNLPEVIEALPR